MRTLRVAGRGRSPLHNRDFGVTGVGVSPVHDRGDIPLGVNL
jgi:hypothetical protein